MFSGLGMCVEGEVGCCNPSTMWKGEQKMFLCMFFNMASLGNGEGNGTPLQYSCLENPMDRGAWKAAVRGVAKGWTRLSDFAFSFHFHALEKEMATHSSVLAWRIPGTAEPGGLPSIYGIAQSQTRLKRLSSTQVSRKLILR